MYQKCLVNASGKNTDRKTLENILYNIPRNEKFYYILSNWYSYGIK